MPRAVIWPVAKVIIGGRGWMVRTLLNRLTEGDFSPQQAAACWLRLFQEEHEQT
jgi:hypothetical protein